MAAKTHLANPVNPARTLCGKKLTISMKVVSNLGRVTCSPCKNSPALDGMLGNMTHTGH